MPTRKASSSATRWSAFRLDAPPPTREADDPGLEKFVEELPAKLKSLEKRSLASVRRLGMTKCLEEPKNPAHR